jgi:hypothetical protein
VSAFSYSVSLLLLVKDTEVGVLSVPCGYESCLNAKYIAGEMRELNFSIACFGDNTKYALCFHHSNMEGSYCPFLFEFNHGIECK